MRTGTRTDLGYHDHDGVDGGKQRIILAALVTPADVMENVPLQDLLWRVCFRWKLRPRRVTGDTTYGTVENIVALEDAGIQAFFPLPDFDARTPFFGKGTFVYDGSVDAYRCPGGELLPFRNHKYTERVRVYQAPAATCNGCPLKAQCTDSSKGRQIQRSFDEAYLDQVRGEYATEAYQKARRKRQVWVEPLRRSQGLARLTPLPAAGAGERQHGGGADRGRLGTAPRPLRQPDGSPRAPLTAHRHWQLIAVRLRALSLPRGRPLVHRPVASAPVPFFNTLRRYQPLSGTALQSFSALSGGVSCVLFGADRVRHGPF